MPTQKLADLQVAGPSVSSAQISPVNEKAPAPRRSISDFLAPLEAIAGESPNLVADHGAHFKHGRETYELPRYIFVGPRGGDAPIHLGIFAGLHGDSPESARSVVEFIKMLEAKPELAKGYCLSFYPLCNPSGFEDGTRFSRSGKDLNREFWKNSSEPEVRLLQAELLSRSFQGIILLQTDDLSYDIYDSPVRVTLAKHLLKKRRPVEDAGGNLSAPPKARPRPFEIIFETPASLPSYLNEMTFIGALQMVLAEYLEFIAYAPNL
jgi:murein peptide amidase A